MINVEINRLTAPKVMQAGRKLTREQLIKRLREAEATIAEGSSDAKSVRRIAVT